MVMTSLVRPEAKILRTFRVRVMDKPGYLGKIATRLGELGANIGEIHIVAQGPDFLVRDIDGMELSFDLPYPETEKAVKLGKFRGEVIILPDKFL